MSSHLHVVPTDFVAPGDCVAPHRVCLFLGWYSRQHNSVQYRHYGIGFEKAD